ncbi:hypothetical protein Hanom_Chr05g00445851 [Helianthus anomalus]
MESLLQERENHQSSQVDYKDYQSSHQICYITSAGGQQWRSRKGWRKMVWRRRRLVQ